MINRVSKCLAISLEMSDPQLFRAIEVSTMSQKMIGAMPCLREAINKFNYINQHNLQLPQQDECASAL